MNSSSAITVTNGVQNVRRRLAVQYASDNHAVLINEKCVSVDVRVNNIDVSKSTILETAIFEYQLCQ